MDLDLGNLPERIRAAAESVREARHKLDTETELRNELIVTAIDELGMTQRAVADAAGISQAHVLRILSRAS